MNLDAQVLIVGSGAVGATLACLLNRYGVSAILLDKEEEVSDMPRAVAIDDEVQRVWQHCGILDRLSDFIISGKAGDTILSYYNAAGKRFLSLDQEMTAHGYPMGSTILQGEIEKVLLQTIEASEHVKLYLGYEVGSIQDNGAFVHVEGRRLGDESTFSFNARYLVGCDGAWSFVRRMIGVELEGTYSTDPWLIVDVLGEGKLIRGGKVWCNKNSSVVNIPLPQNYQRWEFQLKEENTNEFSDDDIIRLISKYKKEDKGRVVRKVKHVFLSGIAASYSLGNIFLAGDAAHVTPPFMGQGLCCGIRDVFNLAWKMSFVLKKIFSEDLLLTYVQERKGHQKRILRQTKLMGSIMAPTRPVYAFFWPKVVRVLTIILKKSDLFRIRGRHLQAKYKQGAIIKGGKAGGLMIQPRLMMANGDTFLLDELLGEGFALIAFNMDFNEALSPAEMHFWTSSNARFLNYHDDIEKNTDEFGRWIDVNKRRLIIVRPDKVIMEDRCFK